MGGSKARFNFAQRAYTMLSRRLMEGVKKLNLYMAKSVQKTIATDADVATFLRSITDSSKRKDSEALITMIEEATGLSPKMWGKAIIGFGTYHYRYESGREGDAPLVGFSPRKNEISIYVSSDFDNRQKLLEQLGKHKSGKGCIYLKNLLDADEKILVKIIKASVKQLKETYP